MKKRTTPQLLANALLELSEKKDIDKIKIKEIVAFCGLSSQTFYNHFSDKYDLILWIQKSESEMLMEKLEQGKSSFRDLIVENLRFYSEHSNFMLNAIYNTHGQDSYFIGSSENEVAILEQYLEKKNAGKKLNTEEYNLLRMYVYACTGFYAYWAKNGKKIPIETVADYSLKILPEALKPYFL